MNLMRRNSPTQYGRLRRRWSDTEERQQLIHETQSLLQNLFDRKSFRPKKFSAEKFFGGTNFSAENFFDRKFLPPKKFSAGNVFDQANFRPKSFSAENFFGRKLLWPPNFSVEKFKKSAEK